MAMNRLREVLGDVPERPTFIETVPRHGYRFIAPVEKPSSQAPSERAGVSKRRPERLVARAGWIVVGATLLLLLSGIGIWRFSRKPAESPLSSVEVVPLVALQGEQSSPAFSRDGNQVAFAEFGQPNTPGIYTTLIGGEKSLRLTDNPGDCCPTWSPDSRQIAFLRYSKEGLSIYAVPALGGTEHRLYTGHAYLWKGGLDWSPDGLKVAFGRGSIGGGGKDLFVLPVTGGEPRRLTFDNKFFAGSPVWTQDGSDIVFSSDRGGLLSLWRISASGGIPRSVTGVGAVAFSPSIPRKGNQLVYQHVVAGDNIWRINLKDEKHRQGSPAPVISARGINLRPNFSPDGKKIAFESDRLGYSDIWYCDNDGSDCTQLTSLHGTAGTARWSPDGHYIAFEFHPQEYYEVYVVEVPGGRPRLVSTFPGADNGAPDWSRDGQWIYFYSDHEGDRFSYGRYRLKVDRRSG